MHLPIKYQLEGKMLGGMNVLGFGGGGGGGGRRASEDEEELEVRI